MCFIFFLSFRRTLLSIFFLSFSYVLSYRLCSNESYRYKRSMQIDFLVVFGTATFKVNLNFLKLLVECLLECVESVAVSTVEEIMVRKVFKLSRSNSTLEEPQRLTIKNLALGELGTEQPHQVFRAFLAVHIYMMKDYRC